MMSFTYVDLPVPNNVRATVLSHSSVEVTWDQSSEATEYTIFYKIPFIFNFSRRSDDSRTVKGASTTSYILTNLEETLHISSLYKLLVVMVETVLSVMKCP